MTRAGGALFASLLAACGADESQMIVSATPSVPPTDGAFSDRAGDSPNASAAGGTSEQAANDGSPSEQAPLPSGPLAGVTPAGGGEAAPAAAGEASSPAPGQYGERVPLLAANSEMAVADIGGKIYVLGGYPSSRDVQTTVQVYDPAADAWSLAAPMPLPTHHPVAVGFEGKIYSLGGQLEGDVNTERAFALDTASDVWTELAPLPTARGGGAAARIDDQIYVVGGRPAAGNAFEVYDVSDDAWTVLPSLPLAFNQRNHLSAVAIGGKVYVAGGRYDGAGFGSPMTDSLDIYDPATNTWSSGAPLPRPRGGVNGVAALGCFYVWGGEGAGIGEPNDVFPDHDVYDPETNLWTSLPPLPVPVHGVTGGVFLDGLIYIPGGGTASGGNSGSVLHQVYRPTQTCDSSIIADVVR